ncbi:NAD-dependent DNA ligase LigA [Clostridium sp. AF34-13]|uniref:NAD-dependent DNA ligase LigA n=1 Tax=Clostridium sp. AF34-13 TaxID=2293012 RepID=UPI000E4F428F|nr:NAD-dependent DNA ligase LigA [Clostridium sp. AF34-13]RHP22544.1 NAD-dependent DNA ligase LigA [Clostridium sp. AF34-13]
MNRNQIVDRVNELNKASEAYYNTGQPIMSDAEFDNKLEKLRQWEEETGIVLSNSPTHNVGATVLDNIKEVTHKTPMLSLEKCHSTEEIVKFANNHNLVASVKLDGLTVRLTYKDGDLILAESRGNGTVGSDVTEHVKQFTNVPLHINKEGTYIIDGEALIKVDDFAEINKNEEYKNSRNLAAGTLSSLDTSVVKDRKLSWYAWEVAEGDSDNSFYKRLLNAQNLGFDVVPCYDITINEFNQLQIHIDNFINIAEIENLPQDGVVFKFDDITYGKSLGNTSHHFRNGIAYKIFNDSVETTLRDIKWSCGKTGVLTPVAIFDTVDIEGSEVSRASLHNVSVMNEILGRSWKGQKISVYKANMIIPAIRWAEQFDSSKFDDLVLDVSYINIPDKCPICGQSTKIIKDNNSELLVCTNDNCKGELLGKLIHAASKNALNIDGLSESTIEKFINLGWLNSIKDIYHLSDHENEIKTLNGFGKKSVEKLLLSIEKSRNTSLERFIYSLSIPSIGKSVSKDISKLCEENFNNFIALMKSAPEKLLTINGFGVVMMNSMAKWWHENSLWVYDLSKEFTFEKSKSVSNETSNTLQGKTFVVTGSVNHYKNRDELKTDIVAHGGTVVGSVSSKTNYLINNDINSTSSKNKKAKSLNIPIITENEFIKMLHNS